MMNFHDSKNLIKVELVAKQGITKHIGKDIQSTNWIVNKILK